MPNVKSINYMYTKIRRGKEYKIEVNSDQITIDKINNCASNMSF